MCDTEFRTSDMFHSVCIDPPGKDHRPISAILDECADAQPQCQEMCSRNANNFALYIAHLNTHLIEFRTSGMFHSLYIDPPVRIIAQ